ncbi:MAG: hypothetical protein H7Y07_02790, partial [Pyrinomonadaceae bacterium]|nr:hypothetical protein [Sphingobacteriaceae bacterium]
FVWKRVADSTIRISKVLEQGITISGRASEAGKNKPLIKANISLRTPNAKGIKFHSTQTDSLGRFYIDRLELYGTQGIKLAAMNNKGEPYGRLTMDSVFNDTLKVRPPLLKPESEELEEAKSNTLLAERLLNRKKTYKLSDTIQLAEVKIKQKMKPMVLMSTVVLMDFGYPEENFTVTTKDHDYQSLLHYLLTKSGYSTSQIRGLRLTRGELYFKTGTMPLSEVRPLIIINGRIVYDPYYKISRISEEGVVENEEESDDDIFASMSMDMIEKINIKKIVVTPGTDIGFILDITTKPGALDWKQRDKVIALINGYYQSRTFYSPLYEKPVTTPDNRHTIFWQPFLATNEKGEASVTYYNADPQGKIRIAVEGLGEKGGIVVGRGSYEVK